MFYDPATICHYQKSYKNWDIDCQKECEMGYEPTWIHCFQTMWTGSWAVLNPLLIFSGAVLPVILWHIHWGASQSMNWESHSWPTRIGIWTLLELGFDIQKWEFTNVTAAKKCGDLTSKKVDSLHWKRYASNNVMGIGYRYEIYWNLWGMHNFVHWGLQNLVMNMEIRCWDVPRFFHSPRIWIVWRPGC